MEHLLVRTKERFDERQSSDSLYGGDLSTSFAMFWTHIVQRPGSSAPNSLINMGRFVGVIEKSLTVSAPPWWIDMLVRSEHRGRSFPTPSGYYRVNYGLALQTYGGRQYRIKDHELTIKSGETRPSEALENYLAQAREDIKYIECAESGELLICAFSSDRAMSYPLVAFDLKRKKAVWKSTVWAAAYTAGSGPPNHFVELLVAGDKAVVFGADSGSLYIEAFSVKDGAPLCRFSSSLWGHADRVDR